MMPASPVPDGVLFSHLKSHKHDNGFISIGILVEAPTRMPPMHCLKQPGLSLACSLNPSMFFPQGDSGGPQITWLWL